MHRNDSIVTLLVGRKTKEMTSDNQKAAHFFPVVIFDREPTTIYFHHESHGSYASMQWAYSANNSMASATKFACQSIKMCSLQSSDAILTTWMDSNGKYSIHFFYVCLQYSLASMKAHFLFIYCYTAVKNI